MILDEIDAKLATAASTPASASKSAPASAYASTPCIRIYEHPCVDIGIGEYSSDGVNQYSSDGIAVRSGEIRRAGRASAYLGGAVGVAKPLLRVIFMSWSII
jgi:hypothetical protein